MPTRTLHPLRPLRLLRRAERILCVALEYEGEASKPTCACWVGERANCFAVGYDDGSVLLWGVPASALHGARGGWEWAVRHGAGSKAALL